MAETSLPTNRLARISLYSGILTLISFCIGWMPFLLGSSLICYPAAFFFGAISLMSGAVALLQIRKSGQDGRWMALTGAILGGLLIFVTLCAIVLTLSAAVAFIAQTFSFPLSTPQAP